MGTCLFCDETKLTKEHIFPDWIVRLFDEQIESRHNLYTAFMERADGTKHSWPAKDITHTRKLVCGPCNNKSRLRLQPPRGGAILAACDAARA